VSRTAAARAEWRLSIFVPSSLSALMECSSFFSLSLSLSLSLSSVCFCFLFFFFTVPRVPNAPRLAARFTGAPVIPNFVLHPAFGPNVSTSSTSPPLRPNFIGLRRPA